MAVLIAAGGESTTSLTGTAVRILADRADLQDQLRGRSIHSVPTFVEEACRFDPPFRGHYRTVKEDVELDGTFCPGRIASRVWCGRLRIVIPLITTMPTRCRSGARPNPRHHMGFGWGIQPLRWSAARAGRSEGGH